MCTATTIELKCYGTVHWYYYAVRGPDPRSLTGEGPLEKPLGKRYALVITIEAGRRKGEIIRPDEAP